MEINTSGIHARIKLAELIEMNYKLLPVLERTGIKLGFGETTIGEACAREGISTEFFILICNIHTYGDYIPGTCQLSEIEISDLVTYLHNSHTYYTDRSIPRLEAKLNALTGDYQPEYGKIIKKFFDDYRQELTNHFSYEENTVFPYIRKLLSGSASSGYSIEQFEENHSNIDEKLNDLKNIILKYLPPVNNTDIRNEALVDIFQLEEDIYKHTLLENMVLTPLVAKLEKSR